MPKFIVKHPERGEMTFPLNGDRISLGRRADNQIQINHGTISGHHAELVAVNGHYVLRDLDSTNHCFVDGFQVTEADLSSRCAVMIGTVECEFIPDDPEAPTAELDNLRKTVGLLREQNEELVAKLTEQQKQIDILGSARLLTPATGADLATLREQVRTLTSEKDRLAKENTSLKAEVERLRVVAARTGEATSLKATVPISLPVDPNGPVAVGPGGTTTAVAPMAKVIAPPDPVVEVAPQLVEFTAKLKLAVTHLVKDPDHTEARKELSEASERLAERSAVISGHPVARLLAALDALVRDVVGRPEEIPTSTTGTLEDTVELLNTVLAPDLLSRAKSLPEARLLVASDDEYLLPGMLAALEFARLPSKGCGSAEELIALVKESDFDLLIKALALPDATPQDACAALRGIEKCEKLPVIGITGENTPPLEGVSDWMARPLNLFELALKANLWVLKRQLSLN